MRAQANGCSFCFPLFRPDSFHSCAVSKILTHKMHVAEKNLVKEGMTMDLLPVHLSLYSRCPGDAAGMQMIWKKNTWSSRPSTYFSLLAIVLWILIRWNKSGAGMHTWRMHLFSPQQCWSVFQMLLSSGQDQLLGCWKPSSWTLFLQRANIRNSVDKNVFQAAP